MTQNNDTNEQDNALRQSLELLAGMPDAKVRQWGLRYDWRIPVIVPVVEKDLVTDQYRSAGDILIDFGDRRLLDLMLRPDMFHYPQVHSTAQSLRGKRSNQGLIFNEEGLWNGVWIRSLATGDLDLIRQVEEIGGERIAFPKANALADTSLNQVLSKLDPEVRMPLLQHLFFVMDSNGPIKRMPKDQRDTLTCLLIHRANKEGVVNDMLTTLKKRLPEKLFVDLVDTQERLGMSKLSLAFTVLEAAKEYGFHDKLSSTGCVKVVTGLITTWKRPDEMLVAKVAESKLSNTDFRTLAHQLLDWEGTRHILKPDPVALTRQLARRGVHWSQETLDKVRATNPTPDGKEIAWLLLSAPDSLFQQRLEDFLVNSPTPEQLKELATVLSDPKKHGDGFPRIWERADFIAQRLDEETRELWDELVEKAIIAKHKQQPEVAGAMRAVYVESGLQTNTAASKGKARTPKLRL